MYLFVFVLKCFAVGRVVGGGDSALALSLQWNVFSCPAVHGAAWLGSDGAECGGTGAVSLVFW